MFYSTLLQPLQPAHCTRADAMGAKTKVPTPDPVTQRPEREGSKVGINGH